MRANEIIEAFRALLKVLPGWAVGKAKTITLLTDQELVLQLKADRTLIIKKVRCVKCGECCLDLPDDYIIFGNTEENACKALDMTGMEWKCTAKWNKPFTCLFDPIKDDDLDCAIEHVVVKDFRLDG